MTSHALTPDSLEALKSQRDDSARVRSALSPDREVDTASDMEAAAVRAFSAWFGRQHTSGGIAASDGGVLDILPSLSRQFCVGLHDLRYFIGVPKECMCWFADLPWSRVEVASDSGSLAIRCKQAKAPGVVLPAFALRFDVRPPGYTRALLHYHYVDVRAIDAIPSSAGNFHISREVYQTLNIRVLPVGSARPAPR